MRIVRQVFLIIVFWGMFMSMSFGQNLVVSQSNESGIYKCGERIQVKAVLQNAETNKLSVAIRKNYSNKLEQKDVEYKDGGVILFDDVLNEPSALIFEVKAGNETSMLGLVVGANKFAPGTERPADFDKYWSDEKRALREIPMDVKSVPCDDVKKGYYCADVELNCIGKPARGYFAKPISAEPKSLPIVLFLHAAGVNGHWCLSKPQTALHYAQMGKGTLAFDLNAHGMLNGQPQKYYDDLANVELKGYATQGIESRQDFYFRGMYLRLIRTLDFLTSQPEWDGKRILLYGESQGGGQALAGVGLDDRVTAAVVVVPAMCDWGGTLVDRKGGWPNLFSNRDKTEELMNVLPYFDVAHLIKDTKASICIEIGLSDLTCPASATYAAINQANGEKTVFNVPYREHHMNQKQYADAWKKSVAQPRSRFINEYLR
ncbi:MAG: acetylxylan esterase [Kiritimatiellae bacterium]|jgi:cephalosporin-C deacetylase|nr:acetylxylan esterase [Kiritimatiellia bacterium]